MKIAFLNKYQDKVQRGAETFVFELSERLSKNHKVDVISNINYWHLLKNRYDVIIPTNGRWQALFSRKIAWLTHTKIVISGQSGVGFDDRVNLYTFPNVFVALTEYQKLWAQKVNPLVKVVRIPNGVDLEKFKFKKISSKVPIVLSVGAFTKEKRHNLTIDAVSKIPDAKLIILGGGGYIRSEIEKYGREKLGDRFEIKTVDYKNIQKEFQKASVFAFPTVPWESFGIVLVEAMATGLPVVATNDPARSEIVGDSGILVNPENTEEYSKALIKAMNINWGDRPRKQAEKFSWDNVANQYEKLFTTL